MTVAYRNLDAVVDERFDRFRARRAEERDADRAMKRDVRARRVMAAGGVGTAAGLVLFVNALSSFGFLDSERETTTINTYVLVCAWAALGIAGAVAWPVARYRARRALQREPTVSGDTTPM